MLMYSILADLGTHNYFRVTMSHQERVVVGNNYLPFESLTLQNWVGDRNAGLTYCNRSPFDAVTWKNLHMPSSDGGSNFRPIYAVPQTTSRHLLLQKSLQDTYMSLSVPLSFTYPLLQHVSSYCIHILYSTYTLYVHNV